MRHWFKTCKECDKTFERKAMVRLRRDDGYLLIRARELPISKLNPGIDPGKLARAERVWEGFSWVVNDERLNYCSDDCQVRGVYR